MSEINNNKNERFQEFLLEWGKTNIQSYPWRFVENSYFVLVSEFMLHRTQSRQVVPIFMNFIEHYPDLESAALADPSKIRKELKSLGLNWRIEGMIEALNEIWEKYGGVPLDIKELLSINGIGQYIAGATVCFSQNIIVPLIDSNIVRVVGRVFGLDLRGEARRKKEMILCIQSVVNRTEPRKYHYAVIDLAHSICKPKKPKCDNCPLAEVPCSYWHTRPEEQKPQ